MPPLQYHYVIVGKGHIPHHEMEQKLRRFLDQSGWERFEIHDEGRDDRQHEEMPVSALRFPDAMSDAEFDARRRWPDSKFKRAVIHLASVNPDLRPHPLPILMVS